MRVDEEGLRRDTLIGRLDGRWVDQFRLWMLSKNKEEKKEGGTGEDLGCNHLR